MRHKARALRQNMRATHPAVNHNNWFFHRLLYDFSHNKVKIYLYIKKGRENFEIYWRNMLSFLCIKNLKGGNYEILYRFKLP